METTIVLAALKLVGYGLSTIGPGLGIVGPTGSFGAFSPWAKLLLSFDMLAGRLEIFPMLLLFAPSLWRGTHIRRGENRI